MDIKLKYGKQHLTFEIPESAIIPEYREPVNTITRNQLERDLRRYLPGDDRYGSVSIVVSDKTRLCGYPEILGWITELLLNQGAGKENICFYIAYGTHPRQTEEESLRSYGPIYREFPFVHHDCSDEGVFDEVATTQLGTPVTIRKDIRRSSLIITVGSISHHYFAGYGGGRKLLFPGLASRKAIYHNHGLFLDRKNRTLAAGCQPGNLEGNPLAGDLKEIDSWLPYRISVHGILDSSGNVCRLMTGDSYGDFIAACNEHDGFFRYRKPEQYDLVLASSGGYPKDINFIQAHKSVHHAAAFVRDGGNLVVLSECMDGIGSGSFMKYLEAGSFEKAFDLLQDNYEGNGGTALSMMTKTARIRIHMLTSLDESICKTLGVEKIKSGQIQRLLSTEKGKIAVIPNASMLVK